METCLNQGAPVSRHVTPGEDLARVMRDTPAEAILVLAPGEHRPAAPLVLDRPLAIRAASAGCRLTMPDAAGWVLLPGAALTVSGLELGSAGPLIEAADGRLELIDCQLRGPIRLGGRASARLVDCSLFSPAGPAIHATDGTELHLSGCHVVACGGPGLALGGEATGSVANCLFERNAGPGIALTGSAHFSIESDMFLDNHGAGLSYDDEAGGSAYGNLAQGNAHFGVALYGRARPTLAHNTLRRNQLGGLLFAGRSGGVSRADFCDDTGPVEIFVGREATPRLIGTRAVITQEGP